MRPATFRRSRAHLVLSSAILSFLGAACAPKQAVDASAISPLVKAVTTRHDAYVNQDATLSGTEKSVALRSSSLLNETVDTALAPE